jgi:hypothetical protein
MNNNLYFSFCVSEGVTGNTPQPTKIECRGACFSPDGSNLLSIQCSRRGPSHLVRWTLSTTPSDESTDIGSMATSGGGSPVADVGVEKLNITPEK